jgi:Zn-dependent protease
MTGFDDPAAFIQSLLLKIPALLFAVTIHEFAHGIVADRLGDSTPRRMGRLTLNPLPHIDLFGALAFVIAGFGWAKPVPVNANNLRHPVRDMSLVAAAGPLSNFLVAFLGLVALVLHRRMGGLPGIGEPIDGMLFYLFQFNLALAIFNLIPVPPLDGGHFLPYLLPGASWRMLHQLEQYGPLVLLLLVVTGATRYIIGPVFGLVSGLYVWLVQLIL